MEGRRWETRTLDALRSVMMLMVFTGHYGMCFYSFAWYVGGQYAVNGFMSISFTTMVLAYHPPTDVLRPVSCRSYALFLSKRLVRLLPLFYLHKLTGWLLAKRLHCAHDPRWDEFFQSEGLEKLNEITPMLDWALSTIWAGGDASGSVTVLTNVHLWFLETMVWLYVVFPFAVEYAGSSRFNLLSDAAWCVAQTAVGMVAVICWLVYVAFPALALPATHVMFDNFCYFGIRVHPLTRLFSMTFTIKATLAVTRRQWVPSRACVFIVLSSLFLLLLFSIVFFRRHYFLSILESPRLLRLVPALATADISLISIWCHRGVDLVSMLLWSLAAPIFVHLEYEHRERVGAVLCLPPVKLLISLSRFSLSFYVWQYAAIQLTQLEATKLVSGTATCYHETPNLPFFSEPALPTGFAATLYLPALGQLLLLAILSHHLIEEPSNALLKRLAESVLSPGKVASRPLMI